MDIGGNPGRGNRGGGGGGAGGGGGGGIAGVASENMVQLKVPDGLSMGEYY